MWDDPSGGIESLEQWLIVMMAALLAAAIEFLAKEPSTDHTDMTMKKHVAFSSLCGFGQCYLSISFESDLDSPLKFHESSNIF